MSRPVLVALLVGLTVGVAVGYLVGHGGGAGAAPRPSQPTSSLVPAGSAPVAGGQPVVGTGKLCSSQLGDRLQLAVEAVNRSAAVVNLRGIEPDLPLGGLRVFSTAWAGCGELAPQPATTRQPLQVNATVWISVTLDVLEPCPAPYPVRFIVNYTHAGQDLKSDVGGFADLGDVPWSGCSPGPR